MSQSSVRRSPGSARVDVLHLQHTTIAIGCCEVLQTCAITSCSGGLGSSSYPSYCVCRLEHVMRPLMRPCQFQVLLGDQPEIRVGGSVGIRAGTTVGLHATHVGPQQPMGGYCIRSSSRSGAAAGASAGIARVILSTMRRACISSKTPAFDRGAEVHAASQPSQLACTLLPVH